MRLLKQVRRKRDIDRVHVWARLDQDAHGDSAGQDVDDDLSGTLARGCDDALSIDRTVLRKSQLAFAEHAPDVRLDRIGITRRDQRLYLLEEVVLRAGAMYTSGSTEPDDPLGRIKPGSPAMVMTNPNVVERVHASSRADGLRPDRRCVPLRLKALHDLPRQCVSERRRGGEP